MKQTFKSIETTVVKEVEGVTKSFEQHAQYYRKSVMQRFPFLVIGLSTFGVVSVFYGFEKIIDSIPFLEENPTLMLLIGLISLSVTGTLYKKLR